MPRPRFSSELISLSGGQVLLAGGTYRDRPVATAERYDPRTNRWTHAGSLREPRHLAGSALLQDGRVLLVGGSTTSGEGPGTASAEIYDVRVNRWNPAASMQVPRREPALTVLGDGRVLVVSSASRSPSSAELYDPTTNTWTAAARMPLPAIRSPWDPPFSQLMQDGRVLVVGGFESDASSTTYDPVLNEWTRREYVPEASSIVAGTGLVDGRFLVVGTNRRNVAPYAATYGASGWARVSAPPPDFAIQDASLVTLPSGNALLAGRPEAALYYPREDRWTRAAAYLFPHTLTYFSPNPLQLAPVAKGAVLMDQGLNRYSSAERFFEP